MRRKTIKQLDPVVADFIRALAREDARRAHSENASFDLGQSINDNDDQLAKNGSRLRTILKRSATGSID